MKKVLLYITLLLLLVLTANAQTTNGIDYSKAFQDPSMRWTCPDVDKYRDLLSSLKNEDAKIYANNVKDRLGLYPDPAEPANRYIVSQTNINIENPLYDKKNLLDNISQWLSVEGCGETVVVDTIKGKIYAKASINVATHSTYLDIFKVYVSPNIVIQIVDKNTILVSLAADSYENKRYACTDNKYMRTTNAKISEVFPFNPKSSSKITYAKAYVGTYQSFWDFIAHLRTNLNLTFSTDKKLLSRLRYEYSADSLAAKYGELTKSIVDNPKILNINRELRFYESAQKLVFMGKTVDFKDIVSCEITDDPTFIPGKTTIVGAGISIFGFGIGGAESYTSPTKKIHNYVVNIKIDNLKTPYIRIATGNNEAKAKEIESSFEYILRHQQDNKKKITKRKK